MTIFEKNNFWNNKNPKLATQLIMTIHMPEQ